MRFAGRFVCAVFPAIFLFLGCAVVSYSQQEGSGAGVMNTTTQGPAVPAAAPAPAVPAASASVAEQAMASAPDPQTGYISGAVQDAYGDLVEGATAVLEDGTPADRRTVETNDNWHVSVRGPSSRCYIPRKGDRQGLSRLDFAGDCPEARRVFHDYRHSAQAAGIGFVGHGVFRHGADCPPSRCR